MAGEVQTRTGRPRKALTDEQRERLSGWAARGFRKRDVAALLEMSADTLRRIMSDDERASRAWDFGRALLLEEIMSPLIERAKQGETVPALFLLKTLYGFREGTELDGDEQRPLVSITLPGAMNPEDYAKLIGSNWPRVREVAGGRENG
jgi:hypothetical protein